VGDYWSGDDKLGNKGISLRIANNAGKHVGTLGFGRATLRWRKANSRKPPVQIPIEDLIEWLKSH
jgi:hypothetical protein